MNETWEHEMKRVLVAFAIFAAFWSAQAYAIVPLKRVEVRGIVEHWSATERVIVVAEKRYRLAPEVDIVDGNGKAVGLSALRSGIRGLLIESEGEVGIVTINPRGQSSENRPTR